MQQISHITNPSRYLSSFATLCVVVIFLVGLQFKQSHADTTHVKRVEDAPIMNLYRMTPQLYSGGQPKGEEAFMALKGLGINTIISVDGARPDVETAHSYGMEYVHLPIGYDEVPEEQGLMIAKAIKTLDGPVYVHCHHGKHRGPAAAAVGVMASEGWDNKDAVGWLKTVGTSTDYPGLYDSVESFVPPSEATLAKLPNQFPEVSAVPPMAETMAIIDRLWDNLKDSKKLEFKKPSRLSKTTSSQEVLQLQEHFHELLRQEDIKQEGRHFIRLMEQAENASILLRQELLELENNHDEFHVEKAMGAFKELEKSCKQCHYKYRNT